MLFGAVWGLQAFLPITIAPSAQAKELCPMTILLAQFAVEELPRTIDSVDPVAPIEFAPIAIVPVDPGKTLGHIPTATEQADSVRAICPKEREFSPDEFVSNPTATAFNPAA